MPTAVLIVNYKSYGELGACLASLAPYLSLDDEIVVVDYESDARALDAAIEVGRSAAGRSATASRNAPAGPNVTTLRRADNLGFAAGVNMAAACTRAPYLLLLNPDTSVEGPVVRVLEDWMAGRPDVGVTGARVMNADGSVQATARRFPDVTTAFGGRSTWLTSRFPGNWFSRRNLGARGAQAPVDVDWVSGACLMTRRDLFERVGGFDETFFMYWEDADYCYRLARAGYRCSYVPGVPGVSVRHTGGRSAAHDPALAIRAFHRSAFHLYRKHASPFGQLAAPLVGAGLWLRGEWRLRQALGRGRRG